MQILIDIILRYQIFETTFLPRKFSDHQYLKYYKNVAKMYLQTTDWTTQSLKVTLLLWLYLLVKFVRISVFWFTTPYRCIFSSVLLRSFFEIPFVFCVCLIQKTKPKKSSTMSGLLWNKLTKPTKQNPIPFTSRYLIFHCF